VNAREVARMDEAEDMGSSKYVIRNSMDKSRASRKEHEDTQLDSYMINEVRASGLQY